MATSETTTLRVPVALRDEIARLAEQRRSTMLDVVTVAIERLRRDEWWAGVHDAVEAMSAEEQLSYDAETTDLDATVADGLDEG